MNKILIVKTEDYVRNLLKNGLEYEGYKCECTDNGKIAADYIEEKDYDLIVLDILIPEIDGYELLKYIKDTKKAPTIFITSRSQTKDKIKALNSGADDYITSPFEIEEIVARIQAILRRYNKSEKIVKIDNMEINIPGRTVKCLNKEIDLTPKEFDLLTLLIQNRGTALYREIIFEKVWGEDLEFETRTLDLHIQRLRKKLNWKDKIKTIYKVGYMLEA